MKGKRVTRNRRKGVTGANALEQSERHRKVIEMARAGMPLGHIARECGYASESGPHNVLKRWMDRYIGKEINAYRAEELDRTDRLIQAIWRLAVLGQSGRTNDQGRPIPATIEQQLAAMDRLIRIIELRGKLTGALKVMPDVTVNVASVDLEARIAELRRMPVDQLATAYRQIAREQPLDVVDVDPS